MSLQIPHEKQLAQTIANTPVLKTPYFQNKGITEAIADLAKEKFAGGNVIDLFARLGAADIVKDLRNREFDGEELSEAVWQQVLRNTEKALRDSLNQPIN